MAKQVGLRLTLGHAPNTPHIVIGLPGFYRPDQPTPVGGPGELSVERAKQVAKDPGFPLELADVDEMSAREAREEQAKLRAESARSLRQRAKQAASREELEQIKDEAAAVSGKEDE